MLDNNLVFVGAITGLLGGIAGLGSFIWQIYAYYKSKGKLELEAHILRSPLEAENEIAYKNEVVVELTNTGNRRVVFKEIYLEYPKSKSGIQFSHTSDGKCSWLDPNEFYSVKIPFNPVNENNLINIYAKDSLGNLYSVPRKNLKQLKKNFISLSKEIIDRTA